MFAKGVVRGLAIAGGLALAVPFTIATSAAGAASNLVLNNGPFAVNVRAGTAQNVFQFVRSGSATGPVAVGVKVHFDSISGPDAGQHAVLTTDAGGGVVWPMSTTAAKPGGGSDVVRAWVDTNKNDKWDAGEPRNQLSLTTLPTVNQPPLAGSVEIDLPTNDTTNIRLGGLDPDGTRVGYSMVVWPKHGTIPSYLTGPFVPYTPTPGYVGDDTMTYRITDSDGAHADGVVTVHVIADASTTNLTCNGKPATIVSTGNEVDGTGGPDVIVSLTSGATIRSGDGDDTICAPNGNNRVYGGGGNDTIIVGDGDNFVAGNDGDDVITAGDGTDTIYGGNGNDRITAGNGASSVFGESGDDVLTVGTGYRMVLGGDGNDRITAAKYTPNLWGGTGDDTFVVPGATWRS